MTRAVRFVNADDVGILGVQNNLYDKNLYAYCDNNPVTREDKSGRFWNVVIGATVGAAAGLVGQIVSDGITSLCSGKLTISNWQTYTGAILGGAAGGAVLGATGNVNLSNAVTGTVTTGAGQTLEKLTIKGYDKSWGEIAANTVADGAISYSLGKLPGVKKVTSGRNSQSAVYRSGLTKLRHGTASRMSIKVIGKGLISSTVGGGYLDVYYGLKQLLYDRIKSKVRRI